MYIVCVMPSENIASMPVSINLTLLSLQATEGSEMSGENTIVIGQKRIDRQ
jgi:hypothetical protein